MTLKDEGPKESDDTARPRLLLAESRYAEAVRAAESAIAALGKGGASPHLADALTVLGVARARLGEVEESLKPLRRALRVAEEARAYTNAAQAALAIIEEHGAGKSLPRVELYDLYRRADEYLAQTQWPEEVARLRACARVVIRRLAWPGLHEEGFTFYGAVQEFEAHIIEQALEEAQGSVTGASKLLGLKHQTLISMIETRHKDLRLKRKAPERRLKSIIKKRR